MLSCLRLLCKSLVLERLKNIEFGGRGNLYVYIREVNESIPVNDRSVHTCEANRESLGENHQKENLRGELQ